MIPDILICHAGNVPDRSVARVAELLAERGARPLCLDTNLLPMEADLIADPDGGGLLRTAAWSTRLERLRAAWVRHCHAGISSMEAVDPDHRRAIRVQTDLALRAALSGLACRVIDPPDRLDAAPFSLAQLRLARRCGLRTPETAITNDPATVRAMLDRHPGVICKMIQSSSSKVPGPRGWDFVPTRRVTADDLPFLPRVALCPMVFQEEIPKARELRITAVGDHLFAATRLQFATFDILLTPAGEHVFLEFNCVSFYDFIEETTGLPISAAVADLLLG